MMLLGFARKTLLACLVIYLGSLLFAVSLPADLAMRFGELGFAVSLVAMIGIIVSAVVAVSLQLCLFLTRSPKNG